MSAAVLIGPLAGREKLIEHQCLFRATRDDDDNEGSPHPSFFPVIYRKGRKMTGRLLGRCKVPAVVDVLRDIHDNDPPPGGFSSSEFMSL